VLVGHRKPGPIDVPDAVASRLAELRAREGVTLAASLDIDSLRDVERAVGLRLADDVLALLAAHLPSLEEGLDLRLAAIVGHTGAARERGARGDLVALGCLDGHVWLCVDLHRDPSGTRLRTYDAEDRSLSTHRLVDWLDQRLDLARESAPGALPAPLPPFAPRLVARPLESSAAGRRVRHAAFGEGILLAEQGTGPDRKVKCEFPGLGVKLLKARFLDFLE
jgi:hypothetical protein